MERITIDSILGGQSPTTHFSAADQFRASLGIDPALPIDDSGFGGVFSEVASGLLRPVGVSGFDGSVIANGNHAPYWFIGQPKTSLTYVYDIAGSAYSINNGFTATTALSDGGSLSSSSANGAEYYDNYIYFAKNTDIARYGPLDGAPVFNGTYWTGTLGKAALTNTSYPAEYYSGFSYPNHVLHRHSDGKLYIADVVGNQGTIHVISTSKAAVEGDTDNGSTANKLQFGYGLWPTAIESYGSSLAIALYEGVSTAVHQQRAKIAIWDTTSANFNSITWVEFPDPLISAMKNVNGVLYVFSGNTQARGVRISRYVGGSTFQEVAYLEDSEPPLQGAVDGMSERLVWGSYTEIPETAPIVFSLGLQKASLSKGIFKTMRPSGNSSTVITALRLANPNRTNNAAFSFSVPIVGWSDLENNKLEKQGSVYSNAASVFWSRQFNIGQPFEIKRIRIPLAQTLAAGMTITPKLYFDNGIASQTLTTIDSTAFPNNAETGFGRVANIKTAGDGTNIMRGQNSFWLELRWTGATLCTVDLPIIIDLEIIPD